MAGAGKHMANVEQSSQSDATTVIYEDPEVAASVDAAEPVIEAALAEAEQAEQMGLGWRARPL